MGRSPCQINLDYWPETEAELEAVLSSLRAEYRVQASRKTATTDGTDERRQPIQTLHIHILDCPGQ